MTRTNIEWTRNPDGSKGETWPVVTGCTPVSESCRNCYAARMAATRLKHHPRYKGLAVMRAPGMPRWTGEIRLNHDVLEQPLRWKKPRMVFVASMGDLFHEDVLEQFIFRVLKVTRDTPQHTYQILTKRPGRMAPVMCEYYARLRAAYGSKAEEPQCNLWLGVSIENQATADGRREYLEQCPAAVKFVSYEPALGPVDWTGWEFVDQIISGGESGPHARPSHPDWHRATRDFCQKHGIAYFFKAWGAWKEIQFDKGGRGDVRVSPRCGIIDKLPDPFKDADSRAEYKRVVRMSNVGKKAAGYLLDGRVWQEFPVLRGKERNG